MQTYDWLSQGENIIFESAASKVWNVKGINLGGNKGGKLILTDKQLVFQAYVFNIGTRLDKIPLENITGTAKTKFRMVNSYILPTTPINPPNRTL